MKIHICAYQSSHYFIIVCKINDYPLNNINKKNFFLVVACQRYLCPNVISMTMNVFIFRNLSLKTVFIEPYVKINYLLSLSLYTSLTLSEPQWPNQDCSWFDRNG